MTPDPSLSDGGGHAVKAPSLTMWGRPHFIDVYNSLRFMLLICVNTRLCRATGSVSGVRHRKKNNGDKPLAHQWSHFFNRVLYQKANHLCAFSDAGLALGDHCFLHEKYYRGVDRQPELPGYLEKPLPAFSCFKKPLFLLCGVSGREIALVSVLEQLCGAYKCLQ